MNSGKYFNGGSWRIWDQQQLQFMGNLSYKVKFSNARLIFKIDAIKVIFDSITSTTWICHLLEESCRTYLLNKWFECVYIIFFCVKWTWPFVVLYQI